VKLIEVATAEPATRAMTTAIAVVTSLLILLDLQGFLLSVANDSGHLRGQELKLPV
jgi:hypothetical protein